MRLIGISKNDISRYGMIFLFNQRLIKIKANLSPQERENIHHGQCTHDYYHFFQCNIATNKK